MATGESDLGNLLGSISPRLNEGSFVFCQVERGEMPPGVEPLAMFQEAEATTVVLTRQQAEAAGLDGAFPSVWITLDVASDLEAVGFLAVITAAMAAEDIGINVVSAYHHDHLFVREDKADRAMSTLRALEALRQPNEPT